MANKTAIGTSVSRRRFVSIGRRCTGNCECGNTCTAARVSTRARRAARAQRLPMGIRAALSGPRGAARPETEGYNELPASGPRKPLLLAVEAVRKPISPAAPSTRSSGDWRENLSLLVAVPHAASPMLCLAAGLGIALGFELLKRLRALSRTRFQCRARDRTGLSVKTLSRGEKFAAHGDGVGFAAPRQSGQDPILTRRPLIYHWIKSHRISLTMLS